MYLTFYHAYEHIRCESAARAARNSDGPRLYAVSTEILRYPESIPRSASCRMSHACQIIEIKKRTRAYIGPDAFQRLIIVCTSPQTIYSREICFILTKPRSAQIFSENRRVFKKDRCPFNGKSVDQFFNNFIHLVSR